MKSKREEKELHRERNLDVCRGVPWNILQNNDLAGQGDGGGAGAGWGWWGVEAGERILRKQ